MRAMVCAPVWIHAWMNEKTATGSIQATCRRIIFSCRVSDSLPRCRIRGCPRQKARGSGGFRSNGNSVLTQSHSEMESVMWSLIGLTRSL